MGADAQFVLHPTHRLWWVSLHQGPQILVLDYCRSTTSGLILEAKISGTKFRKTTWNSAFFNIIIAKYLVNFSSCFGFGLIWIRREKLAENRLTTSYDNKLKRQKN